MLLCALALPGLAQTVPTGPIDCIVTFNIVGGNGIAQIDNRSTGCDQWTIVYSVDDNLSGYTIAFQYATGINGPETYMAYPATNVSNSSSMFGTADNGLATYCNLATCGSGFVTIQTPWVQVVSSGASGRGSVQGTLYGYRTGYTGGSGGAGGGGGGGGGCTAPCLTGTDNDSATTVADHSFPNQADITGSAVSAIKMIAGSMGKLIYVGHLSVSLAAGTTVSIIEGTTSSTPCDTTPTTLAGPYQNTVALALDFTRDDPLTAASGDDLCLSFGGSSTGGGFVKYSQR
jgi:hypothetical protein